MNAKADPTGMQLSDFVVRSSRFRSQPAAVQYGASLLLVAAILALQLWLESYIQGLRFLLFVPAILVVSIAFGRGPAIAAILASAAGTLYFFIEPFGQLGLHDVAALALAAIFVATSVFAINIVEALTITIERLGTAMAQLRKSEAEKGLLLEEVNHRVKNNLQMIGSLLAVQGRSVREPHARQALEAATARVAVMGRVHRRLEPGAAETFVDARAFIGELCEDLRETVIQHRPIALHVDLDPAPLEPHRATNVGLIVNELLTNALKYAFPEGRSGTIRVRFSNEGDQCYCLDVRDDGIGMGETEPSGYGLRLVEMLAKQLGGTILTQPGQGVHTVIRFPTSDQERQGTA